MQTNASKAVILACEKLIRDYIYYIHGYIKLDKERNEDLKRCDSDFDVYEALFREGLTKALKCGRMETQFKKETVGVVAKAITNIMNEHKIFDLCRLYRKEVMEVSFIIFEAVVKETKNGNNR